MSSIDIMMKIALMVMYVSIGIMMIIELMLMRALYWFYDDCSINGYAFSLLIL